MFLDVGSFEHKNLWCIMVSEWSGIWCVEPFEGNSVSAKVKPLLLSD